MNMDTRMDVLWDDNPVDITSGANSGVLSVIQALFLPYSGSAER